jgi:hypothetical protein
MPALAHVVSGSACRLYETFGCGCCGFCRRDEALTAMDFFMLPAGVQLPGICFQNEN